MPPVRWKHFVMFWMQLVAVSSQFMQGSSMTADGWRPIIGTPKEQPVFRDEILHYRNPVHKSGDSVKAETLPAPSTTHKAVTSTLGSAPPPKAASGAPLKVLGTKYISAGKLSKYSHGNPYYILPNHPSHGPHIPLGAVTHSRPGQSGQIKKYTPNPHLQMSVSSKRPVKPVRLPHNREELLAASSSAGAYAYYKQNNINNVKPRETLGLAIPGLNHYQQIDFGNRFAVPPTSESVFQQYNPVAAFVFPKQPQVNEVSYQFQKHNDDYTRNLVPPPLYTKTKIKESEKVKSAENIAVQLPPPYEFQKVSDPGVQVQVTKEKLNVFHNHIPQTYNGEYVDYDFHTVRTEVNKQPTYEVTEGKIMQETPPFRRRKPTLPPKFPEVELNVPPFLPTPYKAETLLPTSPTQNEVSTIFTKLSKLQKEKEMTANPNDYEPKEVSTHYPIIGKPVFEDTSQFTTMRIEEITTVEPETTTRARPTSRRRRPGHRRTTTTTTEETPVEMESYELQKTELETERPRRTRYRTSTVSSIEEATRTRGRHRYRRPIVDDLPRRPVDEDIPRRPPVDELPRRRIKTTTAEPEITQPVSISTEEEESVTEDVQLPENDIEPMTTTEEIAITTTTTTTTTTPSPRHTIRSRKPLYDNSDRPRPSFSLNQYRQKQLSSTTSTTESYRTTHNPRLRFPSRFRGPVKDEEATETPRPKFIPKDPRHGATTDDSEETSVKPITRRPYSRYRSTTATPTTQKVSIRPNLFTQRRRPPMLSLRNRIHNRMKNETETTTVDNEVSEEETEDLTEIMKKTAVDEEIEELEEEEEENEFVETTAMPDILKDEPFILKDEPFISQRVSNLTSSFKDEYDRPGLFNSVSPTSRRIPSHFTIATDDPILPLEKFFSNIKERERN